MLVKSGEAEVTVREAMDRIALRWDLADALAQLTELDRQAVVLVKAEGLNSKEVAAILGISEGAVRWHVMEGLNKMRRFLERQEDDFEPAVCSS